MKSITIIGSGMGGLATGIFGQANGFKTTIFEAHSIPGGQCTSWKRKGYTFDPCIHHLGAGSGQTKIDAFWRQLGLTTCEMVPTNETVSAVMPDGTTFTDYYDLVKLESHLKQLSPEDSALIDEYIAGIKGFLENDKFCDLLFGSVWEKIGCIPFMIKQWNSFRHTLGSFGKRFKHPFLQKSFPLMHTSLEGFPLFLHQVKHAYALKGDLGWPRGGSITVANNMADRYLQMGGNIHYRKKVVKVLTERDQACGVELEDGSKIESDFVVSNADGRKTILDMLSGRYMNTKIASYCKPNPDDEVPWAVTVYLGVKRDLSSFPSAMVMFFEQPEIISGRKCDHLGLQLYGFDTSMAPEGKGVIKVELFSRPSYFSRLCSDRNAYQDEKDKVAQQVITLLENHFPGLQEDIEVINVTTLHTWERYMGGTQGYNNFPNKLVVGEENVLASMFGLNQRYTLPGLKNFFFVGSWATSAGSLFMNALSGKQVVQKVCRQNGVRFIDKTYAAR